ncbi:uncharacterized protein LOC111244030 isoform X2 [Varroa destructor]|uniref:Uncharacterized protein n=1 Tax=Varroa destructor TaxID=109461 RepID=A0A7M7J3D4_VARDE|nr:uncharacterized protein LOC111244030 isoform X2 [Varroa destructor]
MASTKKSARLLRTRRPTMTERTLSQSTTSLVRSKSLRLPSKNKDMIQENIRNVSMLSRSGSLRDHKKNKDLVAAGRDDHSLFAESGRTEKDGIRALSKSCHGSLGSNNSEGTRRSSTSGTSLSFRRSFVSRGDQSKLSARASPASPTRNTPPPRERCELREPREARNSSNSGISNGQDYAADLKLLVAEHLKLQQEYAKVRQQLVDRNAVTAIERLEKAERSNGLRSPSTGQRSSNTPNCPSELSSIPELEPQLPPQSDGDANNNNNSSCNNSGGSKNRDVVLSSVRCSSKRSREELAVEAYRREVLRLQEELHRMQKLYWNQVIFQQENTRHHHDGDESGRIVVDLLNQLEENRGELRENRSKVRRLEEQLSTSVRETATCHDALRDYQLRLDERANAERVIKRQLAEAIEELRETKEALQFAEDELRSMATTESVSSSGMDPQPPQQQKQLSSREKSPEQNSERTPPDGKSHQFASVNGKLEELFYDHSRKENYNGLSRQYACDDCCANQRRLLQAHHVILELGRQLESVLREDGHFAEEYLDLSDLELKQIIGPENVLHYSMLAVNGEASATPTEEVQEIAENTALTWARHTVAVRHVLRARLQDKIKTAQDQIVELKNSLDLMCRRHSDCEELVRSLELKLEHSRTEMGAIRERMSRKQDEHRHDIQSLNQQIDELNSRSRSCRCRLDGVADDSRQNVPVERVQDDISPLPSCKTNMSLSPDMICTPYVNPAALQHENVLLKQEINKLRESAQGQEELVRAMAAKFHCSQQLWEDNYRRTRAELRARDQQVDSVVEVLRGLPDLVGQCAALHLLFRNLTDPGARPPANKLGVKASGVVASAV